MAPVFAADLIDQQWFQMKYGDDPRWAVPVWNDQSWQKVHLNLVPPSGDILWPRTRVKLAPEHLDGTHPIGLHFSAMASHEIYWDGVLIGSGGRPGRTAREEIPGPIQTHYLVPGRLATIGEHEVAVRSSAHHRHFVPRTGYWTMLIGDYDRLVDLGRRTTMVSMISLSGMVLVAIFALLLFLIDRGDRSYLLLCLLAVVSAVLLIAEGWRNLFGYTYNYHLIRLAIITGLTALLSLLLLFFMMARFPGLSRRIFLLLAVAGFAGSLTVPGWDVKALLVFVTGLALSLAWTIRAVLQRRRGSILAIAGLFVTSAVLIWEPWLFADVNLYFGIDFLLLCLLAAHVLQVKQVKAEREEARIKSARLEIELLKKHIQPHYLMNTLTAMAEWMEQEPKEAVKMIEALSEEFRILSDVSHRSLIPLRDELRLCFAHLEIMSRRKALEYELLTYQIDLEAMIPPALIHTLVENAVIHNKPEASHVQFQLTAKRQDGFIVYTFLAPTAPSTGPVAEPTDGTGFRYIKARLQESYGANWMFHSGADANLWITELKIPHAK